MENRDRDKMSHNTNPTEAGDVNRETSRRQGEENDSSADFGQSIGRSEELNSPERKDSRSNTIGRTGSSKGEH